MIVHPFHLAVPVHDLDAAREFYRAIGAVPGVEQDHATIWNFFGHQIVTHVVAGYSAKAAGSNHLDLHNVPVPHFGLVLDVDAWQEMRARLEAAGTYFVIKPHLRYAGTTGEQWTMFLRDPSGNALEFKAFADPARAFSR
jgi:extradiol dioxygenase family protein